MKYNRLTRVNELLKREISELLFRIINERNFDLSAVTITHVITNRDLRAARVFVSIRDHHKERGKMLATLRAHRGEMQAHINTNMTLKYTPKLTFELDTSLEDGALVLQLISDIDKATPSPHNQDSSTPDHQDGTQ